MDTGFFGRESQRWPKSMPWLSSISDNISYFTNIPSQPYTTWSAAGLFVTQCALPLVYTDVHFGVRGKENFRRFQPFPCVADILGRAGYNLRAFFASTAELMNMGQFLSDRGVKVSDNSNHGYHHDKELFDHIADEVIPELMAKPEPFLLVILNDDTHAWPDYYYEKTPYIEQLLEEGYPRPVLAFTWFDEVLRQFSEKLKAKGVDKNTDFAIVTDHLCMLRCQPDPRNVSVFMPWRAQDEGWKRARKKVLSHYDFPTTILKMIGVKYEPPFVYGADYFGEEEGLVPTTDDIAFFYRMTSGDLESKKARCRGKKGFCKGTEF
jgi:phosphoglycerol transferase MdoB-like AlkP superfamily enzyme